MKGTMKNKILLKTQYLLKIHKMPVPGHLKILPPFPLLFSLSLIKYLLSLLSGSAEWKSCKLELQNIYKIHVMLLELPFQLHSPSQLTQTSFYKKR